MEPAPAGGDHTLGRLKKRSRLSFLLFACVMLAVLCSGCTDGTLARATHRLSQKVRSARFPTAGYERAVKTALESSLDEKVVRLEIPFSKKTKNECVSQVLFATGTGKAYEGDVFASCNKNEKWIVINKAYKVIDTRVPFTHMTMTGTTPSGHEYLIVSGVVNNSKIAYVTINFSDGLFVQVMQRRSTHSYAYARTDKIKGIEKIKGYRENGRLVYTYQWQGAARRQNI